MMDGFAQILQRLPTGDRSSSSEGVAPFKVQINFDIFIFKGLRRKCCIKIVESARRVFFCP
jgi:hypothetical protein